MTVALYMDVYVHRAITNGLRIRGVDVLTARQDGFRQATDDRLLDRASELDRILFSQDDVLAEARRRQVEGVQSTDVIFAHQMRITIGQCVQDLELIAKLAEPEELANRVEYLPHIPEEITLVHEYLSGLHERATKAHPGLEPESDNLSQSFAGGCRWLRVG